MNLIYTLLEFFKRIYYELKYLIHTIRYESRYTYRYADLNYYSKYNINFLKFLLKKDSVKKAIKEDEDLYFRIAIQHKNMILFDYIVSDLLANYRYLHSINSLYKNGSMLGTSEHHRIIKYMNSILSLDDIDMFKVYMKYFYNYISDDTKNSLFMIILHSFKPKFILFLVLSFDISDNIHEIINAIAKYKEVLEYLNYINTNIDLYELSLKKRIIAKNILSILRYAVYCFNNNLDVKHSFSNKTMVVFV